MPNVAVWPALIGPFPVFTTEMSGQRTRMLALDWLLPVFEAGSFVAATVAVFGRVLQSAASVRPVTWTTSDAPAARSPNEQVRTLPAMEQSALSSDQLMPAGSGSLSVTPWAVPGPALLTVIVKAAVSPALMGLSSAVLTTVMSGHWTVTDASSVSEPSLAATTEPVLSTSPQVAGVVALTMWTVKLSPAPSAAEVQVRTPRLIEQSGSPSPLTLSMLQLRPASVGSVSVMVTVLAVPLPALLTTMSKPIWSPALTVSSSAVFSIRMSAQRTSTEPVSLLLASLLDGSLVAAAMPVLPTTPQSA